jgi:hypothetical protein
MSTIFTDPKKRLEYHLNGLKRLQGELARAKAESNDSNEAQYIIVDLESRIKRLKAAVLQAQNNVKKSTGGRRKTKGWGRKSIKKRHTRRRH